MISHSLWPIASSLFVYCFAEYQDKSIAESIAEVEESAAYEEEESGASGDESSVEYSFLPGQQPEIRHSKSQRGYPKHVKPSSKRSSHRGVLSEQSALNRQQRRLENGQNMVKCDPNHPRNNVRTRGEQRLADEAKLAAKSQARRKKAGSTKKPPRRGTQSNVEESEEILDSRPKFKPWRRRIWSKRSQFLSCLPKSLASVHPILSTASP